jgi:hypothetical protein
MKLFLALVLLLLPAIVQAETKPSISDDVPLHPLNTPAQIEDYITSRAMVHSVPIWKAVAIARAESNLNFSAKNSSSTASGIYQYVNGTFKWLCIDTYKLTDTMTDKNNPYIQIECTMLTLKNGGEKHWLESRWKWSRYAPIE